MRLGHVLGSIDETARFFCWLLLSDYLGTAGAHDDKVEELLATLTNPSTQRLLPLVLALANTDAVAEPFVPELNEALSGPVGDLLFKLVDDASSIRIERTALDLKGSEAWAEALQPRVVGLLSHLTVLEELLLMRPEAITEDDAATWYLHPWTGPGGVRPVIVHSDTGQLARLAEVEALLVRPGADRALRMDPFIRHGADGRLMGYLCAPSDDRVQYEHYPSGSFSETTGSLADMLADRGTQHLAFDLDPASAARVEDKAAQRPIHIVGYAEAVTTAVDENGKHFRAVHEATGGLHNVVRIHRHLVRDSEYLRRVVATAQTLQAVEHPNLACPVESRFDPDSGCFVVGTPHSRHGRLIDRLPPGFTLPISWSLQAADGMLAALDALAERAIYLSALPGWAVSIGESVQIVPFLAGTEGRLEDGPRFVATLLYRMLTGEDPTEINPLAPSVVRKGVPEPVDHVIITALSGGYREPLNMRADLRTAAQSVEAESQSALQSVALNRTFAHLQRLRPGALETFETSSSEYETSGEWPGLLESLRHTIDALWDPDQRLATVMRLVEVTGAHEGREEMLAIYQRIVELAGDHLPTLQFCAATYRDAIRGSDLMRLYRRILHAAHSEEERAQALDDLASLSEERRELDQAMDYWTRLTQLRSDRTSGWYGQCRVHRILGNEEALADGLATLLGLVTDRDERLDLVRELAVLRAGPLCDTRGAVELLHEVVLHPESGSGAWEVLRDIAREIHDDALLVNALAGLAACEDLADDERYGVQLERAVAVGLRGGEAKQGVAILDELLQAHPGDTTLLNYKALILERAALWLDAAEALQAWAAAESDPMGFASSLRRLARVTHEQLGDSERALELYQGVIEAEPQDREALDYLDEAYTAAEDWAALAQVLHSLADLATTRDESLTVLARLAAVQDELLGDAAAAFHTYRQLLTEAPNKPDCLGRFVELADATEGWDEAQEVVETVLPHLEPETSRQWRKKLGRMKLDHAEDVGAAVDYFRNAVDEEPKDVSALEGLAGATARIGSWEEHGTTLRRLVDLEETTEKRIGRLHALAETLRDRVLNPRRAVEVYQEILALDPEDAEALKCLSALGEAAGRPASERVSVLQRWVLLSADPGDRLEALEQIVALAPAAELPAEEVAAHYADILELDLANPIALAGLAMHHRKKGEWKEVVSVLEQRIATAGSSDQPAIFLEVIDTWLGPLQNAARAKHALDQLVAAFPDYPVEPQILESIYGSLGQWEALRDALAERADKTLREDERADLLARQGRIHADYLHDETEAMGLMERALTQNPSHIDALAFLADVYVRDEQWREARPVLQGMVTALDDTEGDVDQEFRLEVFSQLAEVHEKLGEDDLAEKCFDLVLESDPTILRGLFGQARLAWAAKEYDKAEAWYKSILDMHGEALPPDELVRVETALSELSMARGDDVNSRGLLEHALKTKPNNRETLRDLTLVCERQGDWAGAAEYKGWLAQTMQDPLEKFATLMELAALQLDKLEDPDAARIALEEARTLKPDSVAVVHQLLNVYLSLERYKQAVEVLMALLAEETEPERRARYTYTLAVLYRDQLHQPRKAVAFLNETLDLDPKRLEAFESLDKILVDHKDWKGQAESYRVMLKRIEGEGDTGLEFRLLRNLAMIYRTGLGQRDDAVVALADALERKPADVEAREQLAIALEEQDPGSGQALQEYRKILQFNPSHVPAWKALGRIFARQRNRDAAWNVCGVLKLLEQADAKEIAFYAKHQKSVLALRKALKGHDDWERFLFDRRQDRLLGEILERVGRALGPKGAMQSLKELGLGPQDAVSLKQKSRFTSFLTTVSKILQVTIPGVYRQAGARGVRKEATFPASMIVGPEMLTGRKGKELRFMIGKSMAYFLPSHMMAGMYPVGHLRTLLLAAMRTVMPEVSQDGEPGVRGIQKQLESVMKRRDVDALRKLCVELTEREAQPNITEWLKQVERTANHTGHLLCNDIEVSVRMLKEEREQGERLSKLTLQEAIEDLAHYSVSERFLALRREVGVAILE